MTPIDHAARAVMWAAAVFTVVFLMTPLLVTVAVSFGSSSVFTLPPPDWSFRWYQRLGATRGLWPALLTSIQVAAVSTAVALALGTLCAIAIVRGRVEVVALVVHRDGVIAELRSLERDGGGAARRARDEQRLDQAIEVVAEGDLAGRDRV